MKELMIALMTWAAPVSGLPMPDTLPAVRIVSTRCALDEVYLQRALPKCQEHTALSDAVYDADVDTIYLHKSFKRTNPAHKAILLHELVHFMQDQAGMFERASCVGPLEAQAYKVQVMWLNQRRIPHAYTPLFIAMQSQCRPEYEM